VLRIVQDIGDERSRTEAEFFQYVSQVRGRHGGELCRP
jgi:hypothetical protein